MAIYRNIQTTFWTDTKVADEMTPEDKLFRLYLLTNPHTNQLGCYEISKRQMANEIGFNVETIEKLLNRFEDVLEVIRYDSDTKEVLVLNWHRHNWTKSPKIQAYIQKELEALKSQDFKDYLHTVSIPYVYGIDNKNKNKNKNKE